MSFKWEKGYKLHDCRKTLIHCMYRKMDMKATLDILKFAWYDCNEQEVREYLKLYPITKEEFLYERELLLSLKKMLSRNYNVRKRKEKDK